MALNKLLLISWLLLRKRSFAGGPPENKNLFARVTLANKKLFAGGPPAD